MDPSEFAAIFEVEDGPAPPPSAPRPANAPFVPKSWTKGAMQAPSEEAEISGAVQGFNRVTFGTHQMASQRPGSGYDGPMVEIVLGLGSSTNHIVMSVEDATKMAKAITQRSQTNEGLEDIDDEESGARSIARGGTLLAKAVLERGGVFSGEDEVMQFLDGNDRDEIVQELPPADWQYPISAEQVAEWIRVSTEY